MKISRGPFVVVESSLLRLFFDLLYSLANSQRTEAGACMAWVHGRFCTLPPDTTDCRVGWEVTVVRVVSDTHWISSIADLNNSFLWIARRLLSLVIAFTFHRLELEGSCPKVYNGFTFRLCWLWKNSVRYYFTEYFQGQMLSNFYQAEMPGDGNKG